MLRTALFVIDQNWKQSKYPSMGREVKQTMVPWNTNQQITVINYWYMKKRLIIGTCGCVHVFIFI